eukprot:CAMPEP_0174381050 /NCGR_PEP_ID=MMETSP0811_2-20130205/123764_1 /TAXON_ID=73025 ORGANISM="Eutreptiella gymnastica-like, Strain CCMP1594" /NCGR_SAMPLE_ID=MMETSP0811_2 /ASSEMBLY_ACC=CAM_ASM_000667 /LENGTH=56 /DNA_ID=CAMNT_0015534079 /DNA_START=698 /DNA_END=868 /DNA_ORIENTATION=+
MTFRPQMQPETGCSMINVHHNVHFELVGHKRCLDKFAHPINIVFPNSCKSTTRSNI